LYAIIGKTKKKKKKKVENVCSARCLKVARKEIEMKSFFVSIWALSLITTRNKTNCEGWKYNFSFEYVRHTAHDYYILKNLRHEAIGVILLIWYCYWRKKIKNKNDKKKSEIKKKKVLCGKWHKNPLQCAEDKNCVYIIFQ